MAWSNSTQINFVIPYLNLTKIYNFVILIENLINSDYSKYIIILNIV